MKKAEGKVRVGFKGILFWWSLVRLLPMGFLWVNVVWGWVINVVTDGWDGVVLRNLGFRRRWYLKHDKRLDFVWSLAMLWYAYQHFAKNMIWGWLVGTFVYYAIGFIVYQFKSERWVMMVFPNMFWELFLAMAAVPKILEWEFVLRAPYPILVILYIYALTKEWWIHIAEIVVLRLLVRRDQGWGVKAW